MDNEYIQTWLYSLLTITLSIITNLSLDNINSGLQAVTTWAGSIGAVIACILALIKLFDYLKHRKQSNNEIDK